jgi:hypothetical protein
VVLHQEVVEEGGDVEEDGLGVEEEFGEEGEVLGVQLGGCELVCVVSMSAAIEVFHLFGRTLCSSPSIL